MKSAKANSSPALPPVQTDARKQRSDGAEARGRLLYAALGLFAEKGFAKTSTREIAQAAGANIAAISYYFGDKAGLYRAAYTEPMGCPTDDLAVLEQSSFTLPQALRAFFENFLEPMKQSDLVQLCMRLHFREMLEPTGVWADEIDNGIKPAHTALTAMLNRHLGVTKADDDIHRLAFSIAGLAVQIFVCRDVIEAIRPKLLETSSAIDAWTVRLVEYAEAMIAAEETRRKTAVPTIAAGAKSIKKKKT